MKYLRHKRGGGKVDMTSEACPLSTVDRDSKLSDKTSVWSSYLTDACIKTSKIASSIIHNSLIEGSLITGGKITSSQITNAELITDYAIVTDSEIYGKTRIAHTAYLRGVAIENWTIYGDAKLLDWPKGGLTIDGHEGYISRGVWTRPPEILDLDGLTITEGVPGFVFCGCLEMEIAHWLKCGDRYGRKLGLTPAQVDEIRQFLLILQKKA